MKIAIIALLLATGAVAGPSLGDFRWKKRLLVVTADSAVTREKLEAARRDLAERDVEIFLLDEPGLDPRLADELRVRLKVRADTPEVLLLGKDGRTSLRWKAAQFTVASLISKIDAMPMRQAEMRERKSGD